MSVGNFLLEGPGGLFQIKANGGTRSNLPIVAPLQDSGGQVYNVKAPPFNALGDNATDDTAAIQSAINACIAAGGGIVFFPVGIYRISATLTIVGNYCTLMGPYYNRDYSDYSVWPGTNSYGVGMTGIKVLSTFSSGNPVVKVGSSGQTFYTLGGGVEKLYLSGDSNALSAGSPNKLGGNGIEQWNAHDFKVRNVCVERLLGIGVYAKGTLPGGVSMAEVDNCLIRGTNSYGVQFDSGMLNNRITSNFISDIGDYGIVNSSNNNYIQNNHIEGPTRITNSGVFGTGINNSGSAVHISYNEVAGCDYHGIYNFGNFCVIEGNTLEQPNTGSHADGSGIYMSGGTTNGTVVVGNMCEDGSNKMVYGIYDGTSSGGNLITNNATNNFTTAGVFQAVAGVSQISDNLGANPKKSFALGNVTGTTNFNRVNGDHQTATQTGNITVTLTNGLVVGDILTLEIVTAAHTQSWPANLKLAGGAYAMSGTSTLTARWDGTNWVEVSRAANIS